MTTNTSIQEIKREEIVDDITNNNDVSEDKMAALKAKMAAKKEEMPPRIVEPKRRSLRMGVVGSGQAGSRLAETFYKLGYPAVVINTAAQDLEDIAVPDNNKLLLNYGLGGAAKDLEVGAAAAESHKDAIMNLIHTKLSDEEALVFCTSLGGGSGAGSSETMIDIMSTFEVPLLVITVLPQASDDPLVKSNSLKTLSRFSKMVQNKQISNLIVVDNAKIEALYSDVGVLNFFQVANKAIVEPLDVFNTLSATKSAVKPLDSQEFGKLLIDGQGLTIYGSMKVQNYEDDTAIAESIINNLSTNLLASGFDIKQARYVGFMLAASKAVWDKVPSASMTYAKNMILDVCDNPLANYHGVYVTDSDEDCVSVYSMFSGLGLPTDRVEQLKAETKDRMAVADRKDKDRNLTLKLDVGEENVNAVDAIKKRIADKKSTFGKLQSKIVTDRRK